MIVFEITGREDNLVYRALETENGNRQYDFLRSIVAACLNLDRPFLSQHVIKALNFQAITCLHIDAGAYRPCEVTVGTYQPPAFYRVPALMDDFVNTVNRIWDKTDELVLATYVLWRLNNIHPFINGNGRTARAACYFVICLKGRGWPLGSPILPELIKRERVAYCAALQHRHDTFAATGSPDLQPLHQIVSALAAEQAQSASGPIAGTAAHSASVPSLAAPSQVATSP